MHRYNTNIYEEYHIKTGRSGASNKMSSTVMDKFSSTVSRCPSLPAMQVKRGGEWVAWTFSDYQRDVKRFARGVIKLGLQVYQTEQLVSCSKLPMFHLYTGIRYYKHNRFQRSRMVHSIYRLHSSWLYSCRSIYN